ncbi:transcriptional regulator, TetR family [Halorientalis persicus]|uniref:Transcriptional regulator, TetR family n=1 Tax=Halorientalis persicus TaxID=1367881 RepID=A0A1H8W4Z2_9EURY|nr:TetR/AcrR family transcriptional regulator [Halorientalis persicus]SEP22706.1 transcriptional regulator, TetR family [Halorientalis persicus]
MKNDIPFKIEASGTEELIIESAYKALLEHGYADVTMKKIGNELPRSTSIIYTYYDSKDDLLFALLQHLLRWFEPEEIDTCGDPHGQLIQHIESMLEILNEESDRNGFATIAELRVNAKHNDRFQDKFEELDSACKKHFSTLIEQGIEKGQYKEVDPEPAASFLYSSVVGELSLHCMSENSTESNVMKELRYYLQTRLLDSEEIQ